MPIKSVTRMRIAQLIALVIGLMAQPLVGNASGQDFTRPREWTDVSGRFKTEASLVNVDSDSVKLRAADGREISLPTGRLSETDRDFIGAVRILQQSAQQFATLQEYLKTEDLHLAATLASLQSAARSQRDGIVAPFFLVVAHPLQSRESRSHDQAQRASRQVIDLIEKVQKYWPDLHSQTLSSIYNNLAVIAARKKSESAFVNYLRSSAKTSAPMISFATHHNVSVALSDKTISASFRSDLSRVLTGGTPQPGPAGPQRLVYTLDHDSFELTARGSTEQPPPLDSPEIKAGLVRLGSGSAFLITPKLALTNRHVAEGAQSFTVRNHRDYQSSATPLVLSDDPRVDLAVLQLASPAPASISTLTISRTNAREQEEMILLGYPLPDVLESTLTSSRGSVSKYTNNGLGFIHEASSDPGSSGGPCIDLSGEVIGVHFGGNSASRDVRNHAVSPEAIRRFLAGANIELSHPPRGSATNFADIVEAAKDAVLFVDIYGPPAALDIAHEASWLAAPMVVYDDCCLRCSGTGIAKCSRCVNGFIETPYVEVVGHDVTGRPITAQKFAKKKCSHCDQRGRYRCPLCGGSGNAN